MSVQAGRPIYTVTSDEDTGTVLMFTFLQGGVQTIEAWYAFMRERMAWAAETDSYLLLLSDMQVLELLPFARMMHRGKKYVRSGAPLPTTRHAMIVPSKTSVDLMNGLTKTLPDGDFKIQLFLPENRDAAMAWLRAEEADILGNN